MQANTANIWHERAVRIKLPKMILHSILDISLGWGGGAWLLCLGGKGDMNGGIRKGTVICIHTEYYTVGKIAMHIGKTAHHI